MPVRGYHPPMSTEAKWTLGVLLLIAAIIIGMML